MAVYIENKGNGLVFDIERVSQGLSEVIYCYITSSIFNILTRLFKYHTVAN